MSTMYVPERCDIVWLSFDPQTGREHSGHRPALVLSPAAYNRTTGLMICCPMTSQVKGYPFEVSAGKNSAILADQVKSLDWKEREAEKKGRVSKEVLQEVLEKLAAVIS